jgi:hypothetical protein
VMKANGDWRLWGRRWPSGRGRLRFLLRIRRREIVREELWGKVERIWETEGREVHRGRWILLETPADMRGYGEGFRRPCCGSGGEAKGERERIRRAIYRHSERSKRTGINSNWRGKE